MDDKTLNTSGDIDQPIDNNAKQSTNNNEQTQNNESIKQSSEDVPETAEVETITTQPSQASEDVETLVVTEVATKPSSQASETVEESYTTKTETDQSPNGTDGAEIATTTTVVAEAIPTPNSNNTPSTEESPQPKKKHTGLIIGLVIAFLLLGGGAFAALAIIKNQPENILVDAFNNLVNAKQVAVTGSFTFKPGKNLEQYIGPINVKINSETANSNTSSSIGVSVEVPDFRQPITLDFGEIVMSDGVFYIKASGLKKIYDDILYDTINEQITSEMESQYRYSLRRQCYEIDERDAYYDCINQITPISDPAISANIQSQVTMLQNQIEEIINEVDDEWFEISMEDVLDSDIVKEYIDNRTRNTIIKARDCYNNTIKNLSDYSNELSNVYSNNSFITMQADQDSFYKLYLDSDKLAGYINAIPKTKLINDYASCNDVTLTDDMFTSLTPAQLSNVISFFPNIYARFDGFLSHRITALKINRDYDYFAISADLNFTYPSNLVVDAPSDSTPVMDMVEDIMEDMKGIYEELDY